MKDDVRFAMLLEKGGGSTIHGVYKKMTTQAKAYETTTTI